MKKRITILTVSTISCLLFAFTTTYKNGTKASLNGEWILKSISIDGAEKSTLNDEITNIIVNKDGSGYIQFQTKDEDDKNIQVTIKMNWEVLNDKKVFKMNLDNSKNLDESEILKLTNNELWLKNIDNGITKISKYEQ